MRLQKCLAIVCVINLTGSTSAHAFATVGDVVTQVSTDSTLFSGWINDQFKKAAAFNSTAGNVVPSQLKLFGFEVGVEAVGSGSSVDVNGLHSLGTQIIDTTQIKMYDHMPFPSIMGHAKVGLPFGLDGGIRVGGIPSENLDNGSTHFAVANTIIGLDVRKALIEEGITRPFGLTVGLNYTHAKGHIDVSTPYSATSTSVMIGTSTYTPSFSASGDERTDWNTNSVGVQAILNKKLLILNPYIGASANHNSGTITSSINNNGTLSLAPGAGSSAIAPQSLTAGGSNSTSPNKWDTRLLAGLEITILPFVKLDLGGELGNQGRFGGNIGLRAQFR